MLQRIQSLFIFLVAICLGLMLAPLPYVRFISNDGQSFIMNSGGIIRLTDGEVLISLLPVFILICISILIALVTIFLFKNRILQMRLSVYNMLLMVGLLILLGYYILYAQKELDAKILYRSPLLFPVLSILFTYLGFRNIRKDEILVKSVDRIR